jgi:hypothetical protein
MDRGFFITLTAVRRQLAAMPNDYYLLRLIHHRTRQPFPAESLWSKVQLSRGAMVRFLRLRNRAGFDIYFRPWAEKKNAGYILLDLDAADLSIVQTMRDAGHEPCVVLQTSPGHLQVWVRVSETPLEPAVASRLGKQLAHAYGGDLASTDWCHLGRLAGFTNQKPRHRQPSGYGPWVRLLQAQRQLATHGPGLLQAIQRQPAASPAAEPVLTRRTSIPTEPIPATLTATTAAVIYHRFLNRLRIPQRFPQPDWSIADLWIAKELLRCRVPPILVQAILRLGSPGFPRRHGQPEDYLVRTLQRAARDVESTRFLARYAAPSSVPPPAPGAHSGR